MIKKYRKKPVIIEAIQLRKDNAVEVDKFCGNDIEFEINDTAWEAGVAPPCVESAKIMTLEGVMIASLGDYIIKGVNGEFYPCKPDIFEKTYEEVK